MTTASTNQLLCSAVLHKGTQQDPSKPALPVGSSQSVEPNTSHLGETLVIGMKVIAQIGRRVECAHIDNADSLPSIRTLGHNT
jgi:hypothetical protein